MFRRLLAIFAVALLAASCSSSDVLATVNGERITKDDLFGLDPDWEDPASYVPDAPADAIPGAEAPAEAIDSKGGALRQSVFQLVLFEAIVQAAEDQFGFSVDEAEIAARMDDPPARYASLLNPAFMVDGTNDEIRRRIAEETLLLDLVAPAVIAEEEGGYEAWLTARPETVTKVCLRYNIVGSSDEASAVIDRLEAGEDFATVFAETSLDQSSPGGYLLNADGTCAASLSALTEVITEAIAAAELNEPIGPIDLTGNFAVLRVDERISPASAAVLAASPMDYLDASQARIVFEAWSSQALAAADIEVSPALGQWSSAALGIIPPSS